MGLFEHLQKNLVALVLKRIPKDDDYDDFYSVYPDYQLGKLVAILTRRNYKPLKKLARELPQGSNLLYYQILVAEGGITTLGPRALLCLTHDPRRRP